MLNLLITSSGLIYLFLFLTTFCIKYHAICKQKHFYFFYFFALLHWLAHSIQCWIEFMRYSCVVLDLRIKTLRLSPLGIMFHKFSLSALFFRLRNFLFLICWEFLLSFELEPRDKKQEKVS